MKNANKPIHPVINNEDSKALDIHYDLTKREYFAGLAMQSMALRYEERFGSDSKPQIQLLIKLSIQMADELLIQLESK